MHLLKVGSHFGSECPGSHAKERSTNALHDSKYLEDKNKLGYSGGFTIPGSET